jgi:hypothetical protein
VVVRLWKRQQAERQRRHEAHALRAFRLKLLMNQQSQALHDAVTAWTTDDLPLYTRIPLPPEAKDWYGSKGQ